MPEKAVRVVITGRVQGVGYRYALRDAARREGVAGWCRNRSDGAVEAVLSGSRAAVDAVVGWCRQGPPLAWVENVQLSSAPAPEGEGFQIRR